MNTTARNERKDPCHAVDKTGSPALSVWTEWKDRCAADRCSPEDAAQLRAFGTRRFCTCLDRYATRTGHRGGKALRPAEVRDAWHLFETYARVNATKEGKRYKDWIFARAGSPTTRSKQAIEAGATLIIRDVAREYLRREHSAYFMESLNAPSATSAAAFTLEELLPSPATPLDEVQQRDLDALAKSDAGLMLKELSAQERILLWAHGCGIPFTNTDLAKWTGLGKSSMYHLYRETVARCCAFTRRRHPSESPGTTLLLCRHLLEELRHRISIHISVEKGAARFFSRREQSMSKGMESK